MLRTATLFFFCISLGFLTRAQDTIYLNNGREVREPRTPVKEPVREIILPEEEEEFKRNVISLNVMDLMLQNISFNIEFIPGSGKTSIVMPLTFYSPLGKVIENGTSSDLGKYHESLATYIRAGFELNYYPLGQKKYAYLTGIGLQSAYLKRDVDVQVDENQGVYQGLYFYFLGKTGVNITFGKSFCLGLIVHAGVKTPDLQAYHFAMLGAVNVGVRF